MLLDPAIYIALAIDALLLLHIDLILLYSMRAYSSSGLVNLFIPLRGS